MTDTSQSVHAPTASLRPKLPGEQTTSGIDAHQVDLPYSSFDSEGLVFFALLLVFVGIVVIVARLIYGGNKKDNTLESVRQAQRLQERKVFAAKPKTQPARFDAKTARHLPKSRVLQGRAWVTDGDTIVINKTQIRLFGIDAPEIEHPFGQKAKWAMVKLCKGHKVTAVVKDVDHYGRTVAQCSLPDGRDLSAELVKIGLAIDWPKYSGGKYHHLEVSGVRRRLWLADARQSGKMYLWEQFEYDQWRRKNL